MKTIMTGALGAALTILLAGVLLGARAQGPAPPASIPTFSTNNIAREGFFYVGGHYAGESGKEIMDGAMYVEVRVPKNIRHPYPIVFIPGGGQTGVDFLQTPDARPGWAYYFLDQGYVVYIEENVARGRSAYVPEFDGKLSTPRDLLGLEKLTDSEQLGDWPQAHLHSQWPGKGQKGDPLFDDFAKTQVPGAGGEKLNQEAGAALLDTTGPAILVTHSAGGSAGWLMTDARPKLVKALVNIEPNGPPIQRIDVSKVAYTAHGGLGGDPWGLTPIPLHYDPPLNDPSELQVVEQDHADGPEMVPCWRQKEPARKLVNLQNVPILFVTSESGYHHEYDQCDVEWLRQAGVKVEFVRLEEVGIHGNGHMMMLEKNSQEIAKFLEGWIKKVH